MTHLFEYAKTGDKFVCRDGVIATFIKIIHSIDFDKDFAVLYDDITKKKQCYQIDGSKCPGTKLDCDIISKL